MNVPTVPHYCCRQLSLMCSRVSETQQLLQMAPLSHLALPPQHLQEVGKAPVTHIFVEGQKTISYGIQHDQTSAFFTKYALVKLANDETCTLNNMRSKSLFRGNSDDYSTSSIV